MALHELGPRTRRIYDSIADRIRSGELAAGIQLPAHKQLAADFGVAPMTIRQVLGRLEDEGLISRQMGRGTFVRASTDTVLVLARPVLRDALVEQLRSASRFATAVSSTGQALDALGANPHLTLLLVELGIGAAVGEFLQTVRRRWPASTVAAVVGSYGDLAALDETASPPLLVLRAPARLDHVRDLVRLAFGSPHRRAATPPPEPWAVNLAGLGALMDAAGLQTLKFQAQLLDAVDQPIVAVGPSGSIMYWNKGSERVYGWTAEEAIGRNAGELMISPANLERGQQIMERLRRGEVWSGEFPIRRRDGLEIPMLVTDAPIRDADGTLIGIIGVAMVLSERHQDRAALESAQAGNTGA